jgi:hypothetical protein
VVGVLISGRQRKTADLETPGGVDVRRLGTVLRSRPRLVLLPTVVGQALKSL